MDKNLLWVLLLKFIPFSSLHGLAICLLVIIFIHLGLLTRFFTDGSQWRKRKSDGVRKYTDPPP